LVVRRSLRSPASASAWRTQWRRASLWTPRSRATCAIGRPDSNTKRTARSRSSSGYFLGAGIDGASTSSRTEPGFEASVKPGLAHRRLWSRGDRRAGLRAGRIGPAVASRASRQHRMSSSRGMSLLARVVMAGSRFANKRGVYMGRRATKIHVAVYRLSRGRVGNHLPGLPGALILLLDHTGAKTKVRRTSPVMYYEDGDLIAVA